MSVERGSIVLGQPYAEGADFGGVERFELCYANGSVLLQILMPHPSSADIGAFQEGQIYLGLHAKGSTIFFLFKIDGLYDWSDQAFSVNLLPPDFRSVPDPQPGSRTLMTYVLIDSVSGLVRGIRVATWSPHMTGMFQRLVRRQIDEGLTTEQHEANVAATYAQFTNSKAMVKAALIRERAGSKTS